LRHIFGFIGLTDVTFIHAENQAREGAGPSFAAAAEEIIVQGLLALAFIAVGAMKLFAYEKYKAQSEKNGPTGITRGLTTFIGVAELAGGLGIVLPWQPTSLPRSACGRQSDSQPSCCWQLAFT
jgi:hypothetical protein